MTTTYHPRPYAAPQSFGRADGGREFGYDGSRHGVQTYLPPATPQQAGTSTTSSALRKGVIVLGAVVAVGAGALLGATLFDKDGTDTTRPDVTWCLEPMATLPCWRAPRSPPPAEVEPETGLAPAVTTVVVPPPTDGPIINLPPAANPNPASAPNPAPAPNLLPVQQAPRAVPVPFPVKVDPQPQKPVTPPPAPTPAPPKVDPPKIDPKIDPLKPVTPAPGPTGPVGPKGPGNTEVQSCRRYPRAEGARRH